MAIRLIARPTAAAPTAAINLTRHDAFRNDSMAIANIAGWAASFQSSASVTPPPPR